MKVLIIDDVPVGYDDELAQLAQENEEEALKYALGLGRRYEEEMALEEWEDDE